MPDFVTSDGAKIHYRVEGREDGPPLVLSNSLATDLSLWDGQVGEAHYRGFRLIRYDQRGHGASSAPEGDYTIERLADDVLELLDEFGIEQTSFCGISLGGMTGIQLAKHHSRRFTRVAVCNATVWMSAKDTWNERIAAVREGGMQAVADATVARWFDQTFRESRPDVVAPIRDMILATKPVGFAGCAAAVRDMDLRDQLGLIDCPVVVVTGSHDQSITPEQSQYMIQRIPGAQKMVLDAGHLSNVEQRDAFNQAVFDFLAGERL